MHYIRQRKSDEFSSYGDNREEEEEEEEEEAYNNTSPMNSNVQPDTWRGGRGKGLLERFHERDFD